ncbi:MAG: DUF3822 family protein [Reichenbachiella sp.]
METANQATYKLNKKIKDSKFDVEKLHDYCLSLQIGIRDFQLCIIDTTNNNCLIVENYSLEGVKTINTRMQVLSGLFDNHHLLKAGFWKEIKVSLKSHKFSLVPASHFLIDSISDYLSLSCVLNPEVEGEYYYHHKSSHVVNTYAADKRLVSWIKSLYPNKEIRFLHQGDALIEGILKQNEKNPGKKVFCIQDKSVLHVFVAGDQKLQYYNQFAIKDAKEFAKYILMVFKEFGLDPKKQQVLLFGSLSNQSSQFKLLKKYVSNISFGQKPTYLKMSHVFDEIPEHQFFDLFSVYLCD